MAAISVADRRAPIALSLKGALRACRSHLVFAGLFSALLNILYLAPTLYMLQVYDRVIPTRGVATLAFLTVILLFSLATLTLLDLVRSRLLVRASAKLDHVLAAPVIRATLRSVEGGERSSRALRDFDTLRATLTGAGIIALFDAPWTPVYILVCFMLHWVLGCLAIAGSVIVIGLTLLNERATKARLQTANDAASRAYFSHEQSVAASDVVRALGMREAITQRHLDDRFTSISLQAEASFAAGGYMAATRFFRLALQSLALGVGAYLAVERQLSGGAIFAASLLIGRALSPIEQVLGAWKGIVSARGAYKALDILLDRVGALGRKTRLPTPRALLEVEQVTVLDAARTAPILSGASFIVLPGEIVGVVGPSGAGKSTLMRVLAGAQSPDRGHVRIDGADMSDWDQEQLGRHIGFLPQDSNLFQGTVRENIARFRGYLETDQDALDAMVVAAAESCGAHQMILRLPEGYETMLGAAGRGLSAGQLQRIALARALFDEPRVVILDEPNSHMDAEGEMLLGQTLARLKAKGVTVFVVAHRAGILGGVDKLMIIRGGQVAAFGPREQVMNDLAPQPPTPVVRRDQPALTP
ncbi:type I secretion system permease/ATPase [Caulobacter sp. S45]|uniref:type I secretion system permease/ATPase n=1 Tax=Caulobacter sp. S45 TaxID=1641861 RepID=UPI00131DCC8A|nr:type I secretion system permease/ATPase [Caulobacter sp. S45]